MNESETPATPPPAPPQDYTQLTQVYVPLDQADAAFASRDASGRIPIVVIPVNPFRVRNEMVFAGLIAVVAGIVARVGFNIGFALPVAILLGVVLIVLGVYRSFFVRIPEGVSGLLIRAGRYVRTLGSGTHVVPPWFLVSRLVARREIPFDAPTVEALTKDNVRANVDTLLTFKIADPYKFVYSISADDFDQVFQAACQDTLRTIIRQITADQVADLKKQDMQVMIDDLNPISSLMALRSAKSASHLPSRRQILSTRRKIASWRSSTRPNRPRGSRWQNAARPMRKPWPARR